MVIQVMYIAFCVGLLTTDVVVGMNQQLNKSVSAVEAKEDPVNTQRDEDQGDISVTESLSKMAIEKAEETSKTVPAKVVRKSLYPRAYFDGTQRKQVLKKLITKETKGIWGAVFECNDSEIIETWAQCAGRVKGCLLLNAESNNDKLDLLTQAGVPIRRVKGLADKYESRMHNKIVIFECNECGGPLVVMGSWNPTEASFKYHFEDLIIIDDPRVVALYVAEFKEMFTQSEPDNEPAKAVSELALEFMHMAQVEEEFPPVAFRAGIQDVIKNLLSWEKERIDGAQFVFIWEEFVNLWEKSELGGSLILDRRSNNEDKVKCLPLLRRLQAFKIKLYSLTKNFWFGSNRFCLLHHKFLIFHNNINGKSFLIAGSANMSDQSLNNNWENAYITENSELINQFREHHGQLLRNSATHEIGPIPAPASPQRLIKANKKKADSRECLFDDDL